MAHTRFEWLQVTGETSRGHCQVRIDAASVSKQRSHIMKEFRRKEASIRKKKKARECSRREQLVKSQKASKAIVIDQNDAQAGPEHLAAIQYRSRSSPRLSSANIYGRPLCSSSTSVVQATDVSLQFQDLFDYHQTNLCPQNTFNFDLNSSFLSSAWRAGWVEAMVIAHFPKACRNSPTICDQACRWATPQSPAMQAANDTMALLAIGTTHKDERILRNAQQMHLLAVRALYLDLNLPRKFCVGTFATALDLLVCQLYSPIAQGVRGLESHMAGIHAIARACYTGSPPTGPKLVIDKFYRLFTIFSSLTYRKRISPETLTVILGATVPPPNSLDALLNMCASLPALLEDSDMVKAGKADDSSTKDLYEMLEQVKDALTAWCKKSRPPTTTYGPQASDLFAGCLHFETFLDANVAIFYWSTMLKIKEALYDVELHMTGLEESSRAPAIAASVDECAVMVCRTLSCLLAEADTPLCKGATLSAPLHLLRSWYDRRSNMVGLRHCNSLSDQLSNELEYFNTDALLPFSFQALLWLT
ncbi:hypothetical protein K461DRAFT_153209 [Myriangium duriaei CBS 260.36]|uniref:Uncharacterized protein n=1 Tax=Myriangium duriaei CBS 260.36 TaxID=1168546 RepID=A0A9P4MH49_9PEZI|nr:hypothetical protein K461DRAFT_153209 [Myriangium duriaei CBS 260.36]